MHDHIAFSRLVLLATPANLLGILLQKFQDDRAFWCEAAPSGSGIWALNHRTPASRGIPLQEH